MTCFALNTGSFHNECESMPGSFEYVDPEASADGCWQSNKYRTYFPNVHATPDQSSSHPGHNEGSDRIAVAMVNMARSRRTQGHSLSIKLRAVP